MITAKDILLPVENFQEKDTLQRISSEMPIIELLPLFSDSAESVLGVEEGGNLIGIIDRDSFISGLCRQISARDDSSIIEVICTPADYSASRLAHAVEDSDAHLVDLFTIPADDGRLRVTLRVQRDDPTSTVHNLERYGYEVSYASGIRFQDAGTALERLLGLKALLSV